MDENSARYEEETVRWGNAAWEKGLRELCGHNFRVLIAVYYMASLFQIYHDTYETDQMLSQAENVMSFELSFAGTLKDSQPDARANWSMKGCIPLAFHFVPKEEENRETFFWTGTGTTSYTGYTSDTGFNLSPSASPVYAEVKILGRSPDYQLSMEPEALSPDMLEYFDSQDTFTINNVMHAVLASLLVEYYTSDHNGFLMDFENDATMEGDVDAQAETAHVSYTLKMTHTPN